MIKDMQDKCFLSTRTRVEYFKSNKKGSDSFLDDDARAFVSDCNDFQEEGMQTSHLGKDAFQMRQKGIFKSCGGCAVDMDIEHEKTHARAEQLG